MNLKKFAVVAAACVGALGSMGTANAVPVALELALLVDVSGSVDAGEYALQKTGYVNAFNNATIQANIASLTGGIAVAYIEWSGSGQQSTEVTWTHITNAAEASAFAALINGSARNFSGSTAPGSALNYVTPLFTNGFESTRQVIDVSGDGAQNDGADTSDARDAALAAGIDTINGLAILGEAGLQAFYQNNIVGGANSFLAVASTFADFEAAVLTKIGREIVQVPEPETLALVGLALACAAGASRRRRT